MLNKVELQNFRRHQNLVIDFTDGIQVIRAANEQGKSSLIESIGYALFGARALRTSVDKAVTWGNDTKTLKVTLTLSVDGSTYVFSRSTNGAEVKLNDRVFVTGQKEVSNHACALLGADVVAASKLMFASQNSIRGALEEGPKALSEMIENLAGFDTFDQILDAASKKLSLGSSTVVEERMARSEARLAEAIRTAAPEPDFVAHQKALREQQARLSSAEATLPVLREATATAVKAWQDGSALFLERGVLETKVGQAHRARQTADELVRRLMPMTRVVVDTGPIEGLKQQIAAALDHTKRKAAYQQLISLPTGPRWAGGQESYHAARSECSASISQLNAQMTSVSYEMKSIKAQRFDSDTCSKCGQKLPNAEHIVARNQEVDQKVAALAKAAEILEAKLDDKRAEQKRLDDIYTFANRYRTAADGLEGYAVWDITTYPGTVAWNGPIPTGDAPNVADLRRRIADIETQAKAVETAKAQLDLAVTQMTQADAEYQAAVKVLSDFNGPDAATVLALTAAKDQAILNEQVAEGAAILAKSMIETLSRDHSAALALWSVTQNQINSERATLAECKDELVALAFNNNLVKKLRAIRPVIANKLWNTVLASVSVMFSTMRREESWITKEDSGFQVNGEPVECLSGSAKDILGLALRCSMLRTFLPQCGLLVLDEPMAGCDETRSETLLGFLKSMDFKQTLLVSHEEVSETVADNLIIL